jgi:hypothetical protein
MTNTLDGAGGGAPPRKRPRTAPRVAREAFEQLRLNLFIASDSNPALYRALEPLSDRAGRLKQLAEAGLLFEQLLQSGRLAAGPMMMPPPVAQAPVAAPAAEALAPATQAPVIAAPAAESVVPAPSVPAPGPSGEPPRQFRAADRSVAEQDLSGLENIELGF